MKTPVQYYIESDGQVYLIEREGRLRLPTHADEIPFEFEPAEAMVIEGQTVHFCRPHLDHHPREWHHKDEIPRLDEADPLVRMAVHVTLPRVVAEAVIERDGSLLLVMPSRGFNVDQWTMPGGFVGYGESPAASVVREVREEIGVDGRVERCAGVETFLGRASHFTWHMFFFEVSLESDAFLPGADEIKEIRWFPVAEAVGLLHGAMRRRLSALFEL